MRYLNRIIRSPRFRTTAGFFIVVVIWFAIASTSWAKANPQNLWIAHPSDVFSYISNLVIGFKSHDSGQDVGYVDEARRSVLESAKRIALSFLLVFVVGTPVGLLFGQAAQAFRVAQGPLELWRAVPPIAVLPVCFFIFDPVGDSSLFGLVNPDDKARILSVLFGCVPILVIQIADTVRSIPEERRAFATQNQASLYFRVRWLLLFELIQSIFISLRTVLAFTVIIIVAGEMAWSPQFGIGAKLINARFAEDPLPASYAFSIIAGMIAYTGNITLHALERAFVTWK